MQHIKKGNWRLLYKLFYKIILFVEEFFINEEYKMPQLTYVRLPMEFLSQFWSFEFLPFFPKWNLRNFFFKNVYYFYDDNEYIVELQTKSN